MYSYNRYGDRTKFVTDESEIEIYEERYVLVSDVDKYDISIVLEKGASDIDDIKKYIMFLIGHICELDNIAQKYNSISWPAEKDFPYELENIHIDGPENIRFEYWGCLFNTQFYVGFQYVENQFVLKSFGMREDIPEDWDKCHSD